MGAEILGGIGGHSVFYLNGACRGRGGLDDDHPALRQVGCGAVRWCRHRHEILIFASQNGWPRPVASASCTAISPWRLRSREPTTMPCRPKRGGSASMTASMHDTVFDNMPPGTARETWKYEVSVGTDYGISLGRGRFCARVPVNREQLAAMVAYLNAQNAPLPSAGAGVGVEARAGQLHSPGSQCARGCRRLEGMAHGSATAPGSLRLPGPPNESSAFDEEKVDETALLDRQTLHADTPARTALIQFDQLPVRPGAIIEIAPTTVAGTRSMTLT